MHALLLALSLVAVSPAARAKSPASPAYTTPQAVAVAVSDVRVRLMPPGAPATGAFLTLKNTGDAPAAVVAAESTAATTVELHTHVQEDGMMKMRQIPRIDVPANGETVLQPGGLHIMLIGLLRRLEQGGTVPLTLVFEDGSRFDVDAPVVEISPPKHTGAHHAGHH